ncbi:MAG: sensor histidine kinase [Deltaproteobacteria bacterium]|nr:sensor histidine kinase [Deltaproteobacteria bacterium]
MAWAGETVPVLEVGPDFSSTRLAPYLEMLPDSGSPEHPLSLANIQRLPPDRFKPNGPQDPNYGFNKQDHWHRMSLRVKEGAPSHLLLVMEDPGVNFYEIFLVENGKLRRSWTGGNYLPFSQRMLPYRLATYEISPTPGKTVELYFILHPNVALGPFSLYSPTAHSQHTAKENMLIGFFFGGLGMIWLYNLFLLISLRDKIYLYYLLQLMAWAFISLILYFLLPQYIWPDSAWMNWVGTVLAFTSSAFFVPLFARKLLETKRVAPKLDRLIVATQYAGLIPLLVWGFGHPVYPFMFFGGLALVNNALLMVTGVVCWRRGVFAAKYYMWSWGVLVTGIFVFILRTFGVFPNNLFSFHGMQLGVLVEMAVLSFALADRFNRMRQEKDLALVRALEHEKTSVLRLRENEELQAAKSQAEAAREKAESATALKDKFVSLVAHDIRSPFSSILVMAQTLEEKTDPPLPPEQKEMASAIQSRGRQLLRMIEDLLNMNRIQTGKIVPQMDRVELWPLVEEVFLLKALAQEKGVAMVNNIPQDFHVWADRQLTFEVLQNLVSNAIKFCSAGKTITVEVPKGEKRRVAVTDNGKGVDPLLLPNLFDPTVKTTSPGTAGERGTGMGLPLCHEIMAAMGGKISVESQQGKGSTFTLEFPAEKK